MQSLKSALVSRLPAPLAARARTFKRSLKSDWIDESEIIARLAPSGRKSERVLVDVGAHHGDVTALFLEKDWSVVAYEPDPTNRRQFEARVGKDPRVQLSSCAVSENSTSAMTLYTSQVSTGISSLSPFDSSHEPTAVCEVVTLAEDLRKRHVERVDFLKIDIEGFDLFALKGFDWTYEPRYVLCEFEDRKTDLLGYSLSDSSSYLTQRGYHLVYSVWEPIIQYGARHRWRGLFLSPPDDVESCWGNILCFREESDLTLCMQKFGRRRHSFGQQGR
jgi:FkbM family methyltransferase